MKRNHSTVVSGYVTVAVHSYGYAEGVVRLLKSHGVEARTEPFLTGRSSVGAAESVIVSDNDVMRAVQILESGFHDTPVSGVKGKRGVVLIPVDFSDYSLLAVRAGFEFAVRLDLHPLILNTFALPVIATSVGFTDSFSEDIPDQNAAYEFRRKAEIRMDRFESDIRELQKSGDLMELPFSVQVAQGLPEEVISEYCRTSPPSLIVMATRGRKRREADLIGSVTAEVIDTCRVPVFTVPEHLNFKGVAGITKLIFFCNLDRQDMESVDWLMTMFDNPEVDIMLIPVNDGADESVKTKTYSLCSILTERYPSSSFTVKILSKKNFRTELEETMETGGIQLLIVPNKKTNIFSRLFKPGIAHRILFERDMPMLALPV